MDNKPVLLKPPLKGAWSESLDPCSISTLAIKSLKWLKRASTNFVRTHVQCIKC